MCELSTMQKMLVVTSRPTNVVLSLGELSVSGAGGQKDLGQKK